MRTLVFEEESPRPTNEGLLLIEEAIGVQLPKDYRTFLSKTNGGMVADQNAWFRLSKGWIGEGWVRVEYFYNIKDPQYPELEVLNNCRQYGERIPGDLLPIAHDSYGNQIVLGIRGARLNKVFFWNHEEEGFDASPNSYHNVYSIINGFAEFLELLVPCPPID